MKKYFWAQVNAYGMANCKYFEVAEGETLEDVISKYFNDYQIIDTEEVTREYAEKHAKTILK